MEKNTSNINSLKEEILNIQNNIEYFSKIISKLNEIFNQKNVIFNSVSNDIINSDKDDFLIDEIILIVKDINDEFNLRNENYFINNKLNELFNNLEIEFNERNDFIFNNKEDQSINNQFFNAMHLKNNNINLFSNEAFVPNEKYYSTSRNRFFSASKNTNTNTNRNLYETENIENGMSKNTDFFNKNQNLINSKNEDNNTSKTVDFSINNSLLLNNNNSIPRLPKQLLNSFSEELYNNYKYILQFIMFEYSNLNYVIKDYNKHKKTNKTLRDLKNGLGNSYKVLYKIYNQEKKNSLENKMEIELQIKAYNNIKKYCEEIFNNICISNSYRYHRIIYENFNEIILNIKLYEKKNYQKIIYMNNNNYLDVNLQNFNTFQNRFNTAKNSFKYNKSINYGIKGTSYDRTLNQQKFQNNKYNRYEY